MELILLVEFETTENTSKIGATQICHRLVLADSG